MTICSDWKAVRLFCTYFKLGAVSKHVLRCFQNVLLRGEDWLSARSLAALKNLLLFAHSDAHGDLCVEDELGQMHRSLVRVPSGPKGIRLDEKVAGRLAGSVTCRCLTDRVAVPWSIALG